MLKVNLTAVVVAFAVAVAVGVVFELLRRRGMDPVARIADALMPPRMSDATAQEIAAASPDAAGAATAAA